MRPRIKKLIGFSLFLPALAAYFFAAAALGERIPNIQILKALYYLIAGIAWAFPMISFFRWMDKDPKQPPPPNL